MTSKDPEPPGEEPTHVTAPPSDPPRVEDGNAWEYPSVDELTARLPTSELVEIIKGALECGRRNLPFTRAELVRAMAFGATASATRGASDRSRQR